VAGLKIGPEFAATEGMDQARQRWRSRTGERGISLVEVLVVLLIVAILLTLAMYSVRSARRTGRLVATVSAAHAYADAADAFAREHDGRYPAAPGVSGPAGIDWPGGADMRRGPQSEALGEEKYYLKRVPEAVQDGSVEIGSSGLARFSYAPTGGGTGYVITVQVDGQPACTISGGAAPVGTLPCSKR
jgi:prepilin-type N-terminal cleavage/methylation domain-containing protein